MDVVVPIEVATRHTVEFLAAHLVAGDSLLEVGFYRYQIPMLPKTTAAAEFAAEVFRDEKQRSANGEFTPVGRRIVAAR